MDSVLTGAVGMELLKNLFLIFIGLIFILLGNFLFGIDGVWVGMVVGVFCGLFLWNRLWPASPPRRPPEIWPNDRDRDQDPPETGIKQG